MKSSKRGFTFVEVLIASVAASVLIVGACEFYLLTIRQWDVQTSYGSAVTTTDTALERVEADARYAMSFSTQTSGSNTLYVFTLPANCSTSANGCSSGSSSTTTINNLNATGLYVPQRVSGSLQYVAGPQVAFYLSNTTGSQSVTGGSVLWRATAPAGGSFTPDNNWSLSNTGVGRCTGLQSFKISTSGMPANTVQVTINLSNTSGHTSKSYTSTREIYMSSQASGSALPAPANLTATYQTSPSSSIALSWTAASGASTYNVYRGTTAGGESATPYASGLTGTTYTDASVSSSTTYYYYVVAVSGSSTSSHSTEASATVGSSGYVTVTPSVVSLSNYYGDEELTITNSKPMTSLTVAVVYQMNTGMTNNGSWNNFWGGYLTPPTSPTISGGTFTYTATETAGDAQTSGTYTVDNSFNLNNTTHVPGNDTYTVQVTAGGVSQTLTGVF